MTIPVLQKSADIYQTGGKLDPNGFERNITFETYVPPVRLTPFVNHFWTIRWNITSGLPYISEQVMHRPYVDVFLSAQESGIQCSFRDKRDYEAADTGRIIGARARSTLFGADRWPAYTTRRSDYSKCLPRRTRLLSIIRCPYRMKPLSVPWPSSCRRKTRNMTLTSISSTESLQRSRRNDCRPWKMLPGGLAKASGGSNSFSGTI